MIPVSVQTVHVRWIEDGFLVFSEMPRRQYSPEVLCNVTASASASLAICFVLR